MDSGSANHASTRKEREKLARQRTIIDAARELFLRKGYHETTLEEIARQADYGKGTIYNYFESKEELFRSIIDQFTDEIGDLIRSAIDVPGSVREKLTAYGKAIIQYSNTNRELFQFIAQEVHRAELPEYEAALRHFQKKMLEFNTLVARFVEKDIALRKARPFDPVMLVKLFDGMVRSYCLMEYEKPRRLSDHEVDTAVEIIVSVFFDGIAETNFKG